MKRRPDKAVHKVVKVAMTLIFLWSCFFWSGVTVLNFLINDTDFSYLATGFLVGSGLVLISLILCWLRFYFIQIIPCIAGLIVYLSPAREMIDRAAKIEVEFKPSFELRYLPTVAFGILSLCLFIGKIYLLFAERAKKREEFDNMPTESVLDKHHDE